MATTTIIDHLRDEHDQVRALFARLDQTAAGDRKDLFAEIVSELAGHEAAEQALVHPRTREAAQGDKIADSVVGEEQEAEELMTEMESMDPESSEFLAKFQTLRDNVLAHAEHEEDKEFPRLADVLDHDEMTSLTGQFERIKDLGPTHPHPHAPNTPAAKKGLGPVAGAFDRARDALRDAMS